VRLEYRIPARGLIGFQGEFMTLTRGTGLMSHVFDDYDVEKPAVGYRRNGVLVTGRRHAVALTPVGKLQERRAHVRQPRRQTLPEGMIIGITRATTTWWSTDQGEKNSQCARREARTSTLTWCRRFRLTHELRGRVHRRATKLVKAAAEHSLRKRYLKENERKRRSGKPRNGGKRCRAGADGAFDPPAGLGLMVCGDA